MHRADAYAKTTYQQEHHHNKSPHTARLERWLGADTVAHISERTTGFLHPIAIAGVPGRVWAYDGDFLGLIEAGQFSNFTDYTVGRWKARLRRAARRQQHSLNAGFASLSDLISEATSGGKKQVVTFQKIGVAAPNSAASQSLWRVGPVPAAGANAAALPSGTVPTKATTGALGQTDATGGDTLHFINGYMVSTVAQGSSLLLCDYLWGGNTNHATTSAAVTGVPTRYQTAVTAPGNFTAANVTTVLAATAHNITLTYVDQDGNTAEAGSAQTVRVSSAVDTSPTAAPEWRYNLNAGDTGLRNITNVAYSTASTGNSDRAIYHPLAILPGINAAATPIFIDGINSAFNFERIYDDACLMFWEWWKSATAAATYSGYVTLCSG